MIATNACQTLRVDLSRDVHTGPCLATHTACSSSLVATHLAASGLHGGEAGAAVAAGVFLILLGGTMAGICQLQVLLPTDTLCLDLCA